MLPKARSQPAIRNCHPPTCFRGTSTNNPLPHRNGGTPLCNAPHTKTIEGYLAAQQLIANIAHTIFCTVRDLGKDVATDARKITVKAMSAAVVATLGNSLLTISGYQPAAPGWLKTSLERLTELIKLN